MKIRKREGHTTLRIGRKKKRVKNKPKKEKKEKAKTNKQEQNKESFKNGRLDGLRLREEKISNNEKEKKGSRCKDKNQSR